MRIGRITFWNCQKITLEDGVIFSPSLSALGAAAISLARDVESATRDQDTLDGESHSSNAIVQVAPLRPGTAGQAGDSRQRALDRSPR
jgi:hypothetical protein